MGVYQYTLRAETREIANIEIGRYAYAYKHSWEAGWGGGKGVGSMARRVGAAHAAADDAAYKNRNVRYFVVGEKFEHGQAVIQIDHEPLASYADTGPLLGNKTARVIGYLSKHKGRYFIVEKDPTTTAVKAFA